MTVVFKKSLFGNFATFVSLGLVMILIEETFASIAANLVLVDKVQELLASIHQYYANNFLLLPGFIVAWYFLATRIRYTQKELFVLVGLFGIFYEKIYIHILTIPILGIPLILPTMFTYIGIIIPSVLSLQKMGERQLPNYLRYSLGILMPIIASMPFIAVHILLSKAGLIDPTVLTK